MTRPGLYPGPFPFSPAPGDPGPPPSVCIAGVEMDLRRAFVLKPTPAPDPVCITIALDCLLLAGSADHVKGTVFATIGMYPGLPGPPDMPPRPVLGEELDGVDSTKRGTPWASFKGLQPPSEFIPDPPQPFLIPDPAVGMPVPGINAMPGPYAGDGGPSARRPYWLSKLSLLDPPP